MSGTLKHSPADVIRQLLVELGLGVDSLPNDDLGTPWQVYAAAEPDGPDEVITVYDTLGVLDGSMMTTGEYEQHDGFQVRVRAKDHSTGWRKINAIAVALARSVHDAVVSLPVSFTEGGAAVGIWSLTLDGTGLATASGLSPIGSGAVTLTGWVKTSAPGVQAMLSNVNLSIYAVNAAGHLSVFWGADHDTGIAINDGAWHHVALTRVAGTFLCTIYLDGSPVLTFVDGNPSSATTFLLGSDGAGGNLIGGLDLVGYWQSTLGGSVVFGLAGKTVDTSSLSPADLWVVEEGAGSTLIDHGSGGHDATISGGFSWTSTGAGTVSYIIHAVSDIGPVLALGKDAPTTRRSLFTLNAKVSLRQLPVASGD